MEQGNIILLLLICSIVVPPIIAGSERNPIPDGVEMNVWEHKNRESNGGFERVTLWSDGRSEVVVAPLRYAHDDQQNLRPRNGREMIRQESPSHIAFVRRNIYPPDIGRQKFKEALASGIHLLTSFKPGYVDGSGTRFILNGGQEKGIIISMFMDRELGTLNHKRFLAVSEILDRFDKSAYEVVPK